MADITTDKTEPSIMLITKIPREDKPNTPANNNRKM
jgi:hypothetical protein